ncbi:unnamed protein product [Darwinula stevensoni]|uniref:Enoyl reductase (ER) domain-containing protein n=1 Tax=Darwinula stevensoni TaxID=69355 RepID=A0A7R8XAE6_9CRUS|nr:unnamed protein product [Darwinula stevensoni]CAG0886614.1 unnamed protein product [Darwinula stevensoni]
MRALNRMNEITNWKANKASRAATKNISREKREETKASEGHAQAIMHTPWGLAISLRQRAGNIGPSIRQCRTARSAVPAVACRPSTRASPAVTVRARPPGECILPRLTHCPPSSVRAKLRTVGVPRAIFSPSATALSLKVDLVLHRQLGLSLAKNLGMDLDKLTMKGVMVHEFGSPDVLKVENSLPIPKPAPHQVLVQMKAAGINPVDTYIRQGMYSKLPKLPYIPGKDGAGIVKQVGHQVSSVQVGQRVFCSSKMMGTYAEYTLLEEDEVFPLGEKLTYAQGAAIGIPYFTAYRALIIKGRAKPGETVFIHGASGAVGCAAIQIAKNIGLKVIATAGSPEGLMLVEKQGADEAFDHNDENHIRAIMKATDDRGCDIVLEMLANENLAKDLEVLAIGARVMVIGSRGTNEINPRLLMLKEATVTGIMLGLSSEEEWKEVGQAIVKGVAEGWVKPIVQKEYPLNDVKKAHHDVIHGGKKRGKLVLVLIEIKAGGLNPIDVYIAERYMNRKNPASSFICGYDGAGIIRQIGKGITRFKEGDHVGCLIHTSHGGSFADFVTANEYETFSIGKLPFSEGACIGIPYFTAYCALVHQAKAKPGETVLVHGASGGVGVASVQLALHLGLKVIGTGGTDKGMQMLEQLGAHHILSHRCYVGKS